MSTASSATPVSAASRARLWFRITAILMLFFAAGHTVGFLTFRPATPEGQAVWSAMNSVKFSQGTSTFTYGGFYSGFGLSISVSQLFSAWVAWLLGSMAYRRNPATLALAWGFLATQVVGIALSLRYFGAVPAVLSVLTTVLIAMGIFSTRRSGAPTQ